MTVATPDVDQSLLENLDWTIPCEAENYHLQLKWDAEPADYLVRTLCEACKEGREAFMGKRCVDEAWSRLKIKCDYCSHKNNPMEFLKVIYEL